jgi:hypothetical protein
MRGYRQPTCPEELIAKIANVVQFSKRERANNPIVYMPASMTADEVGQVGRVAAKAREWGVQILYPEAALAEGAYLAKDMLGQMDSENDRILEIVRNIDGNLDGMEARVTEIVGTSGACGDIDVSHLLSAVASAVSAAREILADQADSDKISVAIRAALVDILRNVEVKNISDDAITVIKSFGLMRIQTDRGIYITGVDGEEAEQDDVTEQFWIELKKKLNPEEPRSAPEREPVPEEREVGEQGGGDIGSVERKLNPEEPKPAPEPRPAPVREPVPEEREVGSSGGCAVM